MQVLVRSIVADREPAILSGSFTPQSFAAAALHDGLDRARRARPDLHLARARAAHEAPGRRRARHRRADGAALVRDDPRRRAGAARRSTLERAADRRRRASSARTAPPRPAAGASTTARRCAGCRCASSTARCRSPGPTLAEGYLGDAETTDAVFRARPPTARGGTSPATPGSSRTTCCACAAASTTSSSRAASTSRSTASSGSCAASRVSSRPSSSGIPDARWGEASVVVVPRGEALRRSESVQLEEARDGRVGRDRTARAPVAARARRRSRDAAERQARPRGDPRGGRGAALTRASLRRVHAVPVCTTQNRLPSVSSSTTQSASSG